jgi:O-antigen chain-terminating methyltransferase
MDEPARNGTDRIDFEGLRRDVVLSRLGKDPTSADEEVPPEVVGSIERPPLLSLEGTAFLRGCYRELLGREADEEGLTYFQGHLFGGMPKEAVLHLFLISSECDPLSTPIDAPKCRRVYERYLRRLKWKRIPLLGSLLALAHAPGQVQQLVAELRMQNAESGQRLGAIRAELDELRSSAAGSQRQVDAIMREMLWMRQELGRYAVLPGRIQSLEESEETRTREQVRLPYEMYSDGTLGVPSYLELSEGHDSKQVVGIGSVKDEFQSRLGRLFRNDQAALKKNYEAYLAPVRESYAATGGRPFLDFGCGRGDFLRLLSDNGIRAIGVDQNPIEVNFSLQQGLRVVIGDGTAYLGESEAGAFCGVSLFQVAEHMPFDLLFDLIRTSFDKIAEGGCLLVETLNPACFRRLASFALDPSHISLPSPDALKLAAEMAGFSRISLRYYAPIQETFERGSPLDFYEGFCLIAHREPGKDVPA